MKKRVEKKLQSLKNKSTFYIAYTDPEFEMGVDNLFLSNSKYKSPKEFESLNEGMRAIKKIGKPCEFSAWFRKYLKLDVKR